MATWSNLKGNSVKELFFQTLAFAEYPASKTGELYRASTVLKIDGLNFKKILFDAVGTGYYSSKLVQATLYGSKNDDASSYETLWQILNQDATNQEVDISEYKWLKFYVYVQAGSYSSGGGFKNITLKK